MTTPPPDTATKKMQVTFEVDLHITPDMLHEALCKAIHEGRKFPVRIADCVADIETPVDVE